MGEQAAAGWYPDGQGGTRFWDGSAWTDQVRQLAVDSPEPTKKKGAFSKVSAAAKKVATDKLAAMDEVERKHNEARAAAGALVTSGQFGTSTVEIYEGGYVRVATTIGKRSPYERLRSIRYTPPAADSVSDDPLPGALGTALAGLMKGGKAMMKTSAPGLAVAGLAHVASHGASVESRTSSLTISTDVTIHSLTNEVAYEFIKKVNSRHNEVGLVLEDAGNAVLRANGVQPLVETPEVVAIQELAPAEALVVPSSATPSLVERLRELAALRAEGILSEEEFADAKRRILSGLGESS